MTVITADIEEVRRGQEAKERPAQAGEESKLAGTYDIPHVAQVLNIGINAAYRAAKAGQIPGVIVVGSRVLVVKRIFDRAMGEAA